MQEEKIMLNVFAKKSTEELYVELFDGRMMPLEELVMDYERLLKEKTIISEQKDDKEVTKELKVGEWFRIDREVIKKSKEEIRRKCNEAGNEGERYWKRFEKSNEIADENPEQYSSLIETYIFERSWGRRKSIEDMENMCEEVGEGMCDEVICDLELQMRICNGESANDLFVKGDKLPYVRVIKSRNGRICCIGDGYAKSNSHRRSPAEIISDYEQVPAALLPYVGVPYAFRRVLS